MKDADSSPESKALWEKLIKDRTEHLAKIRSLIKKYKKKPSKYLKAFYGLAPLIQA